MNIYAEITGIEYKISFANELPLCDFKDFDINKIPTSCLITNKEKSFAISKWVSPKRTRSYPFERVYNTLNISKKITVIPIIKDEGFGGDRDYIQWDTVSLMSLLDVYVIFAYYNDASNHKIRVDKITKQLFDNTYVINKINEISNYHSSALHWNLKEINTNFASLIDIVSNSFNQIENKTGVRFHSKNGLIDFKNQFEEDVKNFMETSRKKSQEAANREQKTLQPKESLQTLTKSTLTIKNYLGGLYYLTTDEVIIKNNIISLIESKHSDLGLFPSKSDIKDGLLKMILYSNLKNVKLDGVNYISEPILQLTSTKLKGLVKSSDSESYIEKFIILNKLKSPRIKFLNNLFREAKENDFLIIIKNNSL